MARKTSAKRTVTGLVQYIMALEQRENIPHLFQSDQELQKLLLTGVKPTGKSLGSGSFGSVEEVS